MSKEKEYVSVVDVSMPFMSMVSFMIKWAIAAIPAMFILFLLAVFFWTFMGGLAGLALSK
jgi:hypothetical protein